MKLQHAYMDRGRVVLVWEPSHLVELLWPAFDRRMSRIIEQSRADIDAYVSRENDQRRFEREIRAGNRRRTELGLARDMAISHGDLNRLQDVERELATLPPHIPEKTLEKTSAQAWEMYGRLERKIGEASRDIIVQLRAEFEAQRAALIERIKAGDLNAIEDLAAVANAIGETADAFAKPNTEDPRRPVAAYVDTRSRAAAILRGALEGRLIPIDPPASPGLPLPGAGNYVPPVPGSAADLAMYRNNFGQQPNIAAHVAVLTDHEGAMRAPIIEELKKSKPVS